jgi:hypothetical protein
MAVDTEIRASSSTARPDAKTGIPHVFTGMYKVVTLK